jgi:hypothetical protein
MSETERNLKEEIVKIKNAMILPVNATPTRQRALRSFIKEKKDKINELKRIIP